MENIVEIAFKESNKSTYKDVDKKSLQGATGKSSQIRKAALQRKRATIELVNTKSVDKALIKERVRKKKAAKNKWYSKSKNKKWLIFCNPNQDPQIMRSKDYTGPKELILCYQTTENRCHKFLNPK